VELRAYDTKLARTAKPAAVLQLAWYAGEIAAVGRPPERVHVVLGTSEVETYRPADVDAYLRVAQRRLRSQVKERPSVLYVLLSLSMIVSLLGMVNTVVLSVFERTRELGMLRAIGMTRRQTRRMVRHESVITALIGAALGLPLGIALTALVTQALADEGVALSLPLAPLVVFALIAIGAGLLAAALPTRRASRLNVLEALQYE